MDETRCERCKGTGWANAARDGGTEDLPMLMQPVGVYQCPACVGRGKVGLSDEASALLLDAVERFHNAQNKSEKDHQ